MEQPRDKLGRQYKETPFILKERIYDMMCYGHPILRTFPRRERKLADQIDTKMNVILELSIVIERRYHKATTLKEIDTELDALRHFVRLAQDEKYFNHSGEGKAENKKRVAPPLSKHQYEVGEYHRFFVREPKKRLVMSLHFKDRVVQWAIYKKLMPYYDKMFIYDSYGCREGKGTHRVSNRLQYWLRQVHRKPEKWYYLKLDVSKYFYRVDHKVLLRILSRRIKDEKLMRLLERIINGKEPFGLPLGYGPDDLPREEWITTVGMPIGNLTSQLFANIYLNELDQYCKHILKIHYYVRYMDDVIILGNDKKELREIKDKIQTFLKEKLKLDLNKKTAIRPVNVGIDFVGFMTWGTHKRIKKSTARRMKRAMKHLTMLLATEQLEREAFDRCMASYRGILFQAKASGLKAKMNKIYVETMSRYEVKYER